MKNFLTTKLFLTLFLLTVSLSLFSQTYYSRAAGAWNDNTSVWSTVSQTGTACLCSPSNSLSGSTAVYVYNTINSYNLLSGLSGSSKLTIEAGDSATINISNLSLSGSASITVNGTLILYGALTMAGSSAINVNSTGTVYIYGNISNSGSASVADNGSLTVHGNVTTSGSAGFTGSGKSYVIGTVTGSNTSMLSVLPDFFSSFSSATGNGLVTYKTSPSLSFVPLQYNNNASSVLTGNGTFANFSSLEPWQISGSNLFYTAGNVGIGTNSPVYPLVVQGTALVNGSLYANNISAANGMSIGTFKIVNGTVDSLISSATTLQLSASTVSVTNNLNAVGITGTTVTGTTVTGTTVTAGTTGPSLITLDGNAGTITSPSGNVGFGNNNITTTGAINTGTINLTKLSVDSATIPILTASRIRSMPGDTAIYLGDSSYIMYLPPSTLTGNIFCSFNTASTGLGFLNKFGPSAHTSEALGNNLKLDAANNIAIGSNITNNIYSSIMLGFNTPALFIGANNNVGIGTTTPTASLDVENATGNALVVGQGNVGIGTTTPNAYLNVSTNISSPNANTQYQFTIFNSASLTLNNNAFNTGGNNMTGIDQNGDAYFAGNIVIGGGPLTPLDLVGSGYPLNVNGIIRAVELRICITGCDFVFDNKYNLMPLNELDQYITLNHHLPGIASAKAMETTDGVAIGKLNSQLLQKVEELTLYTIELKKQMDEMKAEISKLKESK